MTILCGFFQRKAATPKDALHEVRCTLPAQDFYQRKNGQVIARCAKHDPNKIPLDGTGLTRYASMKSITREEFIVGEIMQS
jgi:hypothetical protein